MNRDHKTLVWSLKSLATFLIYSDPDECVKHQSSSHFICLSIPPSLRWLLSWRDNWIFLLINNGVSPHRPAALHWSCVRTTNTVTCNTLLRPPAACWLVAVSSAATSLMLAPPTALAGATATRPLPWRRSLVSSWHACTQVCRARCSSAPSTPAARAGTSPVHTHTHAHTHTRCYIRR